MLKRAIFYALVSLFCSCESPEKKFINYQRLKDTAEARTDFFQPNFIKSTYKAIVFNINDYKIKDSVSIIYNDTTTFMKLKAGKFPTLKPGSFVVIFMDSAQQIVHSYKMVSPLYQRIEKGQRKGLVRIKRGSFNVPVPDTVFSKVILRDKSDKVFEGNIR